MPLGMEIGFGSGDFVFDGNPAPPQKGHSPIQFLAHVCCGQMAEWTKLPLCTEVDLDPGDVGLDGVAAPLKGAQPVFGSWLLWPNGWMDEDAAWFGSRSAHATLC